MSAICKANAAILGAKGGVLSGIAKREAKEKRELARIAEANAEATLETYEGKVLMRVRLQLDKVYAAFMNEADKAMPDAAKLDRLASAQSRLAEEERRLSNRSLPPTLKASVVKSKRAQSSDPEPE